MKPLHQIYKGIHPGKILERELKKRGIRQRPFALSLNEHPQTFNAITRGKRGISIPLALKIEKALELEEGTLVLLQAYYDIQKIKEKELQDSPDLSVFRKSLFWDTDIRKINWQNQSLAVIQRVFERGNKAEKNEITRFYGPGKIALALKKSERRGAYSLHQVESKSI